MKDYIIRKVLDDDELKKIKDLINSTSDTEWIEGHKTQNWRKVTQTNFEMNRSSLKFPEISKIAMTAMDRDLDFHSFTFAESSGPIIVSKYKKESYFAVHEDMPTSGNFTTSIFLNDPKTYIGGELCLYINGKEEKIKLDAGYAITYNTGILHRVNKVESGERDVIVFWSKSPMKDSFLYELYTDIAHLQKLVNKLVTDNDIKTEYNNSSFEESINNPQFALLNIKNKVQRKITKYGNYN
jgi:PKHD-type hydroxylase